MRKEKKDKKPREGFFHSSLDRSLSLGKSLSQSISLQASVVAKDKAELEKLDSEKKADEKPFHVYKHVNNDQDERRDLGAVHIKLGSES